MEGSFDWQSATPIPSKAKRTKDPNWEQKQRAREYRVAARREKRNRKADEKKQRKLNATILRRMTRNPDKYVKNADRNRNRSIETERRTVRHEAMKQIQRLAAIHDPSGEKFNIGAVKTLEDGSVISVEALRRREERKALNAQKLDSALPMNTIYKDSPSTADVTHSEELFGTEVQPSSLSSVATPGISKTQEKKFADLPRHPPSKPVIPEGLSLPEGEENWLALWDLSDSGLERRVLREKKRKAAARKALRVKQQSGKAERRAARDEKRRVYRELKMTWKLIKEEEKRYKVKWKSIEEEEAKKIAVEVAAYDRAMALAKCADLGVTLENTDGVQEIEPRLLGMRGQVIDFNMLEVNGPTNDVRLKNDKKGSTPNKRRVDLSTINETEGAYIGGDEESIAGDPGDFIKLDVGDGQDFEALNYNHKLRRKIRRALDNTQIRKELLVRDRARALCLEKGIEVPLELETSARPIHERGHRQLPNGQLETEKAERVRLRIELAENNQAARVLRKQAKEIATEAGLRTHAEMTGKIAPKTTAETTDTIGYGPGWHVPTEPESQDLLLDD